MDLEKLQDWIKRIGKYNLQYALSNVKVLIDGKELQSAELRIDSNGLTRVELSSKEGDE